MIFIAILLTIAAVVAVGVGLQLVRNKNVDIIVASGIARKRDSYDGVRHVFFCFVDHYEPLWMGADDATGRGRVEAWLKNYPRVVDRFRDNSGRAPQHSFFFPEEEYRPEYLDMLAELSRGGYGDVEVHLHHDHDTSDGLREKLERFKATLHDRHGLLHRNASGQVEYGFIHGNWALDDSRPDGRWCGVKDEITILKETGCYADFTFPSAPHPTQPPLINQIYRCTDDPLRAKSHHRGDEVEYGRPGSGDLLMVTGPLALNWGRRKRGFLPAIENGDVSAYYPPAPDRVDLWVKSAISVRGFPRWTFIKVHTHGAQEDNARILLGPDADALYGHLLNRYNDGQSYVTHFVTAREMYEGIRALENADEASIRRFEEFDYTR